VLPGSRGNMSQMRPCFHISDCFDISKFMAVVALFALTGRSRARIKQQASGVPGLKAPHPHRARLHERGTPPTS